MKFLGGIEQIGRKWFLQRSLTLIWSTCSILFLVSCDESLPLYNDPLKLLQASAVGEYVLLPSRNDVNIYVSVRNIFDETLQGPSSMTGRFEIVSRRDSTRVKTVFLTATEVTSARGFDRSAGQLTLDPKDSVRFTFRWNLTDDLGRSFRTSFFQYIRDPLCANRCLAYNEEFIIRGEVTLFKQAGAVVIGPSIYSLCYVSGWIDPKVCVTILPTDRCNFASDPTQLRCTISDGSASSIGD